MSTPYPVTGAAPRRARYAPVDRPRLRSWLWVLIAGSLTIALLAGWAFYVRAFTVDRHRQLPPGEPIIDGDFSIRVLGFSRTASLGGSEYSDPEVAPPGSEYVVVQAEATAATAAESYCAPQLLGANGQRWERASVYGLDTVDNCENAAAAPGRPMPQTFLYLVPTSQIDRLYGLTSEHYDGSYDKVGTPAP